MTQPLDRALQARLATLVDTGVLHPASRDLTEWAVHEFEALSGASITEETASMLVTHLAMAIERARTGEQLEEPPLDEAELDGLERELVAAASLVDALAERGAALPRYERRLLALHLAAVLLTGQRYVP